MTILEVILRKRNSFSLKRTVVYPGNQVKKFDQMCFLQLLCENITGFILTAKLMKDDCRFPVLPGSE